MYVGVSYVGDNRKIVVAKILMENYKLEWVGVKRHFPEQKSRKFWIKKASTYFPVLHYLQPDNIKIYLHHIQFEMFKLSKTHRLKALYPATVS